jgi:hypothetical protein
MITYNYVHGSMAFVRSGYEMQDCEQERQIKYRPSELQLGVEPLDDDVELSSHANVAVVVPNNSIHALPVLSSST